MCKAADVAKYITNYCVENKYQINYYKTQKLAFLCNLFQLRKLGNLMITQDLLNWACGVAYADVYRAFDDAGISTTDLIITSGFDNFESDKMVTSYEKNIINIIIKQFGQLDIQELISLTNGTGITDEIEHLGTIPVDRINSVAQKTDIFAEIDKITKEELLRGY